MQSPTIFYTSYKEGNLTLHDFLKRGEDISGAIVDYKTQLSKFDPLYARYDILDVSGNLKPRNTLQDARLKDLQNILIQENTLYMVGVVTTVSLILAAISCAKFGSFHGT